MLQPKRTKYRKVFKGRNDGLSWNGAAVSFGEFGLKATSHGQLTARQIEAARRSISRYVKRGGKMWIRVFPDKPITKKPIEVRMGAGKGNVEYWVAQIAPGRMIYEIEGVDEATAREQAAKLAGSYESSRRPGSNFMALANLLGRTEVVVNEDGSQLSRQLEFMADATAQVKLVARAGDNVLMETPGYPRLKQALQLCQLHITHLDAASTEGLNINALPSPCQAKALFLTPGHQYPLGGIMPLSGRLAVLDWAKQHAIWLVEDDYDSEFQYRHRPVASLQGLAGGEGVLFAGSFSKTLFPALRLGYLVAPRAVIAQAAAIVQALHGDVAANFLCCPSKRKRQRRICQIQYICA